MTAPVPPEQARDGRGDVRAQDAEERGQGICRTCLAPIWNEGGTVHHRKRAEGWSDRIERGGDSLVCFKAIEYRHVPLTGREAAIYDHALRLGSEHRLRDDDGTLRETVARAMREVDPYVFGAARLADAAIEALRGAR